MSTVTYPHLAIRSDGVPIIEGVGIKVRFLAEAHQLGKTVEELVEDYPLTPSQIHSALAYYYDHKAEMDKEIAEGNLLAQQMEQEQQDSPIQKKMRELRWWLS